MTQIGLVGPGNVGRSIIAALPPRGFQLGPIISRNFHSARRAARELGRGTPTTDWRTLRNCAIVLVAVPDCAASAVLDAIFSHADSRSAPIVLYTGRSLETTAFAPRQVTRLYPLRVFQRQPLDLKGVSFAICGDRAGIAAARKITRSLGGQTLVLDPSRLEQAVAGSSLASDALTGILELAVQRFVAAGAPRGRAVEAVRRIVDTSLEDYLRSGSRSRPGPLLEGRSKTVRSLLDACRRDDPNAGDLFGTALNLALDALGHRNEAFDFLTASAASVRPAVRAVRSRGAGEATQDQLRVNR